MHIYQPTDKMAELIGQDYNLLQVMSRFSIPLGVGEKSVDEVCRENGVDTDTFLAVLNFVGNNCDHRFIADPESLSLPSLMSYLQEAHNYFLNYTFPTIRRELIEAISSSADDRFAVLIIKYFDNFVEEVREHLDYENATIFPHVDALLNGRPSLFELSSFDTEHDESAGDKLNELKNIIIRYHHTPSPSHALHGVLSDIFNCNAELKAHGLVEEHLFIPAVKLYEQRLAADGLSTANDDDAGNRESSLSPREKEIVIGVVRGLSNKEIADSLSISLNTVLTHRRNIARKLEIHSPAGLTIYAIMNGLITLEELSQQP